MKFRIALYSSDEGYAVQCLNLTGCWSQGESRSAALENIADAIREYLAAEILPAESGAEVVELEISAMELAA